MVSAVRDGVVEMHVAMRATPPLRMFAMPKSSAVQTDVIVHCLPNMSQRRVYEFAATNLRDTLLVRPSVESGPVNLARVLALEEKGLGLSVLEAEDLAVTTDVELALFMPSANVRPIVVFHPRPPRVRVVAVAMAGFRRLRGERRDVEGQCNAPCPGRSFDR